MNEVLAEQFSNGNTVRRPEGRSPVISKVGIKDEEFLNSIVTRISLDFESGVFNSIEKPSKDLFLLAKACFSPLGGLINQVARCAHGDHRRMRNTLRETSAGIYSMKNNTKS